MGERGRREARRQQVKPSLFLPTRCPSSRVFVETLMFLKGHKHPGVQLSPHVSTEKDQTQIFSSRRRGAAPARVLRPSRLVSGLRAGLPCASSLRSRLTSVARLSKFFSGSRNSFSPSRSLVASPLLMRGGHRTHHFAILVATRARGRIWLTGTWSATGEGFFKKPDLTSVNEDMLFARLLSSACRRARIVR